MNFLRAKRRFISFAPIDLKQADIYLRDGWGNQSGVSAVTNTNTEPITETVIALSTCNLLVPVGCTAHFSNDSTDTEYTVASRTTSGGTAAVFNADIGVQTSDYFTLTFDGEETSQLPYDTTAQAVEDALHALNTLDNNSVVVGLAGTDFTITWQTNEEILVTRLTADFSNLTTPGNASLVLTTPGTSDTSTDTMTLTAGLAEEVASGGDVTFTGQLLEVRVGEGNLTYTETVTRDYIMNRGNLDTVRAGDDVPMDLSFDFIWDYITAVSASAVPTIEDALKQRGEASGWITSSSDECEPYCVDVEVHYSPTCGGTNDETIVFQYFRYETLEHDIGESSISCTGKCNVTEATAARGS